MKQKLLSILLIILGVGIPYLAVFAVSMGIMTTPQNTPLLDWLLTYHRMVWLFAGGIGALPYFVGLIIWAVSPYDHDKFGRWLAINLILAALAFRAFPVVGPFLAVLYGLLILYRATRLRWVYRNA